MSKVLSAVAWPYANGPRHIGHVAGFGVPSDVFSRYMRMAGHDVLMVSGSDEHGTPILIAADEAGVTPAGARRPEPPADRRGPRRARAHLRPLHPHDDAQPPRRRAGAVPRRLRERLLRRADDVRRDLAVDRPHPARPLHRGHLPDLRLRRRARRPVRQLRQPARPADLINPTSRINGETPEFIETQHFFLDLPALADALGEWLDEREATGLWRPNVIRFSQNILKEIRPRAMTRDIDWGIAVPLDGWRDNPTKKLYVWFDAVIGYLSASIEWARRTRRPGRVARVVERPGGAVLLLHGQGQHHLPQPDLAGRAAGLRRQGRQGRRAARVRRAQPARPRSVSSEFLTMEGKKFSSSKRVVIYVRDLLEPLPARRVPLLRRGRRPGEPGLRLHLGGVRAPHQRRAGRRLGQPGQPHRHPDRQELRRDPARRRRSREDDEALLADVEAGVRRRSAT